MSPVALFWAVLFTVGRSPSRGEAGSGQPLASVDLLNIHTDTCGPHRSPDFHITDGHSPVLFPIPVEPGPGPPTPGERGSILCFTRSIRRRGRPNRRSLDGHQQIHQDRAVMQGNRQPRTSRGLLPSLASGLSPLWPAAVGAAPPRLRPRSLVCVPLQPKSSREQ